MSVPEPIHRPVTRAERDRRLQSGENVYEGRWRWWYSSIADWMIRNPGRPLKDCAAELGRGYNTILMISSSDTFKDYFAQRKREWTEDHDLLIRSKLTSVAEKSLDSLLSVLEKRGDQVPTPVLTEVVTSSLDRLGFGPKTTPQVSVNVNQNSGTQVVLPPSVTPQALEEARQALRLAEQRRISAEPAAEPSGGVADAPLDVSNLNLEVLDVDVDEPSRAE